MAALLWGRDSSLSHISLMFHCLLMLATCTGPHADFCAVSKMAMVRGLMHCQDPCTAEHS